MIDVTKFITKEDRVGEDRDYYAVKPSGIYPAMVDHMLEVIASKKRPSKFINLEGDLNPLCLYYEEALALGAEKVKTILVPYGESIKRDPAFRAIRNQAITCARKWFTDMLYQALKGKPLGLHILAEDRAYKLS
jgi:hypothetical protein